MIRVTIEVDRDEHRSTMIAEHKAPIEASDYANTLGQMIAVAMTGTKGVVDPSDALISAVVYASYESYEEQDPEYDALWAAFLNAAHAVDDLCKDRREKKEKP